MKRQLIVFALLFIANFSYSQSKFDTSYRILEASYIGLNTADYITTIHGLNNGAHEANPFMAKATPITMLGFKTISTTSSLLLCRLVYKENPKAAKITLLSMNLLTALVVTNNISIIFKIN